MALHEAHKLIFLNPLQSYLGESSLLQGRPIQSELSPSAGQITAQLFSLLDPAVLGNAQAELGCLSHSSIFLPSQDMGEGPRRCWALSAVQDHLRSVQSSDAVMLECIWLFMGSIITVATALSWGNCCFSGLRVLLTAGTAWWWKWRWAGGCHWNHKGEVVASHEFSSVDCCL